MFLLTTLFYLIFISFCLVIDLYFLIPTAKLGIPTGTPSNELNAETETQPLPTEKNEKIFKVI